MLWFRKLAIGGFCFAIGLAFGRVALAAPESGVWVPNEQFTQVNVACARAYYCRPLTAIMISSDQRLEATPAQTQWGICVIGSGDLDSCNVCVTNPPQVPCQWDVVPR